MESIEKLCGNSGFKLTYFIILLAVILLIWWFARMPSEGYKGSGYGYRAIDGIKDTGASSAGSSVRRLGQEFTQPNQGNYDNVHIDEVKEMTPWAMKGKQPSEMANRDTLVNKREAPVFNEIGSTLGRYQGRGFKGTAASAAAMAVAEKNVDQESEQFVEGSPAHLAETANLQEMLYS